jgi:hypothetical protein
MGEMLDVARYGQYGGKLCLLCHGWKVRLPVQHDLTVSIRFLYHPGNSSRHTSADVLSLKQCHIYSRHSSNFGCNTLQFLPLNNQTMSDRHIAHLGAERYPSNLRLYTAGSSLSITNVLATNYAILTWSYLCNPKGFPLLFVIIFLYYSTPANHEYTPVSARLERIQINTIGRRFIKYIAYRHTTWMQTPVSPLQCCEFSHQMYDPKWTFRMCP